MATKYDSDSIETLRFPDSIRRSPAMYIGGTDGYGIFVCLRELLDNAADEYLAGRNKSVGAVVDSDGSYWVQDSGSGIPQGIKSHEVEVNGKRMVAKTPTMQAVFGELHTSGKFKSEAYKVSIGCFTGDTKIKLLSGKEVDFEHLYSRWSNNQTPIPVMSFDIGKQKLVPSTITNVQITKRTRDLVKVKLDDDTFVKCTPEHKFYVNRGGSIRRVQAQNLQQGDSLVSTCYPKDNHQITGIQHIHLNNSVPVYDITVDKHNVFFVAPGVLVANSHGVGVKGTNATSEYFVATTCYKDKWYSIRFEKGILVKAVHETKAPKSPLTNKPMTRGTLIHFKPDPTIFTVKTFPPSMMLEWAEIMSYLSPGFQIVLKVRDKVKVFLSKEGPKDYIKNRLAKLEAEAEPDVFESNSDLATVVVAFSNVDGFELKGFTNGLSNSQGGKHVDSVASAAYKALLPYKAAKQEFSTTDFRDGLIGIVNAKLHKAQFSSQDKARLTDPRMGKDFEDMIFEDAAKFFSANKAMAKRLCERAAKINELKTKFKASKAVATALNKVKRLGLPPNYAPAHKSVPIKDRELILVEGQSAAGPLKMVKTKDQAVLPLRGKILNVAKSKGDKALISRDILNILGAMGFDPKHEDPLKKLQIGKIICLADPDPDGRHINCLLLTLFSKYLPGLFSSGMVYMADAPEFYAIHKDQIFVGDKLSEVRAKLDKAKIKANVSHVKGWGEVDAQVVKSWVVDKDTRKLIKIKAITKEDQIEFDKYMGSDASARREGATNEDS